MVDGRVRNTLRLSGDDLRDVTTILSGWSARRRLPVSLDGLITKWQEFVHAVELGYDYTIYDYTNDLTVRDMLEEVTEAIHEPSRSRLTAIIAPLDERFLAVTRPVSTPLLVAPVERVWWYRVPRVLVGELEQDLVDELK
jgi:hypothetical protein